MLSWLFAYKFYLLVNGFYLLANNCLHILYSVDNYLQTWLKIKFI
jgi:hypothetical protein